MTKKTDLKLNDFPFQHNLKTRWRDLDAFKHVNNATFLSYIEDARIVFFKRWGIVRKRRLGVVLLLGSRGFFGLAFDVHIS